MERPETVYSSDPEGQPRLLLVDAGAAASVSEARRLIDGGGVKVNGEPVGAKRYNVEPAFLSEAKIQVGKKKFIRLV